MTSLRDSQFIEIDYFRIMMKRLGLVVLGCFVLCACKEGKKGQKYLPPSTGSVNSLLVVMDNELWKGAVGDKVRENFAVPVLAMPQTEALFTIQQVPPQIFSGAIANSRAVLFVQQDTMSLAHIKSNVYASPQKIAVIKGEDYKELAANIDKLAPKAIEEFKRNEIKGIQQRFKRSLNKETDVTEEFNISLTIPSAYTVGKHEDNFVWLDRQIPKGNMNLIAYTIPNSFFGADSTFVRDIVKMRDSIGKKYIPGPDVPGKQTYMATEKAFAPYVFPAEVNGYKAAEVRGIWIMENYAMAGPFLTFIVNDEYNDRKLVLEGFIFAPSTNKRDDLLELEAIMRTLVINQRQIP